MMSRFFRKSIFVFIVMIFSCAHASAQVMESTSYKIQSDSINVGGLFSSSTSYTLEDTTGEVGTGDSSSASYNLSAGYQTMHSSFLSLSSAVDVVLSPALGGVTGGVSNGSTSVTVLTDNAAGYTLTIAASSSPTLQSGAKFISDYVPSGGNPDYTFTTDATDSHLAFSPESTDLATRYKDDGVGSCGGGSNDTLLTCWDGLSTTPRTIISRTTSNTPSGTETQIRFRVGIGNMVIQSEGIYTGTTTITALPL